jgi:hypothetical protein
MIGDEGGIDAIARSRNISDGEESDDETAVYSFVSNSEAIDQDSGSKRTRKFFFSFIESLIANIRRLESNLQLLGREEKSKLKGLKGGTGSYHVETAEESCILKSCGKVHIHPKFKRSTKSLQFCPFFASLKPAERRKTSTAEKLCTRCLTTGHRHKDCKSSVVCKNCASDSHHVLLCKLLEGGKEKAGADKKFKKKKELEKAAAHKKSSAHKYIE